jgi:Protein of unknown function with HXXEE motif
MKNIKKRISWIILLAPVIFICHFSEEAPGFVTWFNQHVSRGINSRLFWDVNISALTITVIVSLFEFLDPSTISACLVILWFSFLMFANALFHITGSIVDKKYTPGLVTAIILYIPFYFLIVKNIVNFHRLKIPSIILIGLIGAAPMLIHGYMILFLGDRLF